MGSVSPHRPIFPAGELHADPLPPAPQPCPATNPRRSPVSYLPCKTRGRALAPRAPPSSLCSAWRSCSGDLYLISPGCCLGMRGARLN